MHSVPTLVGIIPAAGYAKRIAPLPCSKEIYPIVKPNGKTRAVASYLMESYRKAGVDNVYIITRKEKWDIAGYFGNGTPTGLNLAYIVVDPTEGVPQTIDAANSFIKNHTILFGFPDILFQPANAFNILLKKQRTTGADLVLGLFKARRPEKTDMIAFNEERKLKDIIIKPAETNLIYTWMNAVWTPVFTSFLQEYLLKYKGEISDQEAVNNIELYLGDVFRNAIGAGLRVSHVKFKEGTYLDIGTPADLKKVHSIDWI